MKIFIATIFFIATSTLSAQTVQNFGVSFGGTSYITDTNAFDTKTKTGFSIGLAGNFQFGLRHELTLEVKYNRHQLDFIGRRDENAPLEDIKLNLKQFELPVTYTFNFINANKFKVGLNIGASANGFYEYRADNETQRNYILAPNDIELNQLFFDTESENVGINFFAIGGLRFRLFDHLVLNARYYHGLTNPYRQAPDDNPISEYQTDISYYYFGLTYFF